MESLNLNMLANSLPNSNLANAEKDLMNNFKAAALSLTTLYRSSRRTSKRAYNAGYAAACQDLLLMIQQGVSTSDTAEAVSDPNGTSGISIGRVMDYIEARLEAIKSREDEEDEDEEREKREKERTGAAASATINQPLPSRSGGPSAGNNKPVPAGSKGKGMTPQTPPSFNQPHGTLPYTPASPTPSTSSLASPLHISAVPPSGAPFLRPNKAKHSQPPNTVVSSGNAPIPITFSSNANGIINSASGIGAAAMISAVQTLEPVTIFSSPSSPAPASAHPPEINVGTKRRHTAMLIDSAIAPPAITNVVNGNGANGVIVSGRRRTRSSRGGVNAGLSAGIVVQENGVNIRAEAMDVEEEGRERKRIARR